MDHSVQVHLVGPGEKRKAPIAAYLIRGNGLTVLVDTGPSDEKQACAYHHPVVRTPEMELKAALAAQGVTPKDVSFVILTHLHWDHCYDLGLFPNKKIYVQRKEVEYAIAPYPCHYVAYEAMQLGLESAWIPYRGQFELVEGDKNLADGLGLVFLPGHSPGFQGVRVQTSDGPYLIAGDLVHCYENWEGHGLAKHVPAGTLMDLASYYASFEKIEGAFTKILPGHDPRIFEKALYP
ncbi:MAG: N-acyl homoserine lactonase family protein [Deltaproteobacteria bacterium]|nr:N-acyl homoserine lactonase family protein [Deltaproteobacteria bacterium]